MSISPTSPFSPSLPNSIPSFSATGNRRRWDRACDLCRRRKSRCEIQDGSTRCSLCESGDFPCTFVTNSEPRKRKSVPNSCGDQVNKKQSVDTDVQIPRHFADNVAVPPSSTSVRTPQDYAKLEGSSLLKETLGLQNHRHSCYIGASEEFEPVYLGLVPFQKDEYELPQGTLRRVSSHETFLLRPDNLSQNYDEEPDDLDAIQRTVEPNGPALVALYFRIVHPSFPILHKLVFLEKYSRSYREFSPPLLAAVYMLALQWWSYDQNLAQLKKPDATALQKLASKSLDDVMTRPKLSTVQAGLLLSQFLPGDLVPLTARLVAIGQTLGLDRDCTFWRIPDWERGLRKRLAWALYLQDRWVALTYGRSCMISPVHWSVGTVSNEDFPENVNDENDEEGSAEVEKGKMSFQQFIGLTVILSDILESPYGVDFDSRIHGNGLDSAERMLKWAKPVQARLKEWYSGLPESLRMDDVKLRKLSSTGYLHLAYITAEISLHRRMIRWLNGCFSGGEMMQMCRLAAKTRFTFALNFVENLRPVHLQSFWYLSSTMSLALIGSFGVLLWATAFPDETEVDFYVSRLKEYKWSLRVNAKSADFIAAALIRVETLTMLMGG